MNSKLKREFEQLDYWEADVDPVIEQLVNAFIKQAVPEHYGHYVDTDENAGQRLRVQLTHYFKTRAKESLCRCAQKAGANPVFCVVHDTIQ